MIWTTGFLKMLNSNQIEQLQQCLVEDIKLLNLSDSQITDQVYLYLENLSGFETTSSQFLEKTINLILKDLPV